jgi:hypothetical protein
MKGIFRILIKGVLLVTALAAVYSAYIYVQTGRFWVPDPVLRGSRAVADKVADIPITTSTQSSTFETVGVPSAPTYKWKVGETWHYGSKPPQGVEAIMISQSDK